MLVEFSVENFMSIKDRVTLSMVASADKSHQENTMEGEGLPAGVRLLRSAGIYGANASGKSNVVMGLRTLRRMVTESASKMQKGDVVPVRPFRLDPATVSAPSVFEVVFLTGGQRYTYGFAATRERVHEEWLLASSKRSRTLFERLPDGSVHFGGSWRGERLRLQNATRPNALLLSVAVQLNNPTAQPVFDWIAKGMRVISDEPETQSEMAYTMDLLVHNEDFPAFFDGFVRASDLGIDRVKVEERPVTEDSLRAILREGQVGDEQIDVTVAEILSSIPEGKEAKLPWPTTVHRDSDGAEIAFLPSRDESAGTQRLLALAGPWFHVIREGCVLLIDELEAKLHPLMTRFLVDRIHGAPRPAQLVFTTHDSSLLDPDLFRRDQIWFTEKDGGGATQLYSLAEFKARRDENFRAGYLHGRYGAVPFIGDFRFEQEDADKQEPVSATD